MSYLYLVLSIKDWRRRRRIIHLNTAGALNVSSVKLTSSSDCDFREGMTYSGSTKVSGHYPVKDISRHQACISLCAGNDLCYYWSFYPSHRKCYLMVSVKSRYQKKGAISGEKACSNQGKGMMHYVISYAS